MVIDPGNNIHSASSSANRARQQIDKTVSSTASTPASGSGNASDNVSLSSAAQSLAKVENEIAKAPDVNQSKVAEVKAAIAGGRYQIDAESIADKMLGDDSQYL